MIASEDPSEKAAGRGPGILRDGGVEVEFAAGAEAAAARLLNQPFRKHARTGLPLVTLKLAMSLDGQTSTAPGDSPWISGEPAAPWSTAGAPNPTRSRSASAPPSPTTPCSPPATPDARQPLRVVFDSQARLPLDSQLLATLDQSPVLVVTAPDADPARIAALRDAGAEVLVAGGATAADRVTAALAELGRREITSLFLEGGRTLASAFTEGGKLDESRTFIAPVLLGRPALARVARRRGPRGAEAAQRPARRIRPRAPQRDGRRGHPDHGPIQGVVTCSPD